MYVPISDLTNSVQDALKSVGYGRKDIDVCPAESLDIGDAGEAGRRAFVIGINLATGARTSIASGSWGGPNMFDRANAVDNGERVDIPADGAILKGSRGYGPSYARLHVHPGSMGRFLPSGEQQVTEDEARVLGCFKSLKSGEYRQEALRRYGATPELLDSLVSRGYLKRNRAGATQITTSGKNHAARVH